MLKINIPIDPKILEEIEKEQKLITAEEQIALLKEQLKITQEALDFIILGGI